MTFLDPISKILGTVLAFFYGIIPNVGVAIILLTIAVRLVLFPLTAKQAKSMIAMQRAQPEMKRLQAKYKNDRQKLNEEMMKFYKENSINPLAGCLPMLLQLPIWIALVNTLRHIQNYIPTSSKMFAAVCSGASTASQCKNPSLHFLGMDLTKSASNAGGFPTVVPYLILVVLLTVVMFAQQRQMMRGQTQVNPQMQMMSRIMPPLFGVFSFIYPAGVGIYFLVSSIWQIGQQELVFRTIGTAAGPPPGKGRTVDAASKPVDGDGDGDAGAVAKPQGLRGMFAALLPASQQPTGTNGDGPKESSEAKGSGASTGTAKGTAGSSGQSAKPGSKSGNAKSSGQASSGGSKPNASKSSGGGQQNRRRNNRKRKR